MRMLAGLVVSGILVILAAHAAPDGAPPARAEAAAVEHTGVLDRESRIFAADLADCPASATYQLTLRSVPGPRRLHCQLFVGQPPFRAAHEEVFLWTGSDEIEVTVPARTSGSGACELGIICHHERAHYAYPTWVDDPFAVEYRITF